MIVAHNLAAMNANRRVGINTRRTSKTTEKLSSGYRINRSADDAAGLSISEKMRRQIRGLDQASRNCQDGISLCQVADGALNETHDILQRMNELSVQAANDTNTETEREAIQDEIDQLIAELNKIATTTKFNDGVYPLNGGIELPPAVGSVKMNVINNSTGEMHLDGNIYQPGDTVVVEDVLAVMQGSDYNTLKEAAIFYHYSGGGQGYSSSTDFTVLGDKPQNYVRYSKLSDLKVDENGYLYKRNLSTGSDDMYLCESGFEDISDPTPENLENVGALKLIDNTQEIQLQIGGEKGEVLSFKTVGASARELGVSNIDVSSNETAGAAINKVTAAIDIVNNYRAQFGVIQNRLEHTISSLDNVSENTQASESRIRDADMAEEMMKHSANNILSQASQSMLVQANQQQQGVLSLLQ